MNVAIIGLGKMGEALAYRAVQAQFTLFGWDPNSDSCAQAARSGVLIVDNIDDFAASLTMMKQTIVQLSLTCKTCDFIGTLLKTYLNTMSDRMIFSQSSRCDFNNIGLYMNLSFSRPRFRTR